MSNDEPVGATTAVDPDVARALEMDATGTARRWLVRGVVILTLGALVAGGVALGWRASRPDPLRYRLAAVSRGEVQASVEATGSVEPLRTVSVGPDVSGRIVSVHADFNDRVTAGQPLVEIDPLPFRARRAEARARLQAARAGLRQALASQAEARSTAARFEALEGTTAISGRELDAARSAREQASAAVSNARAQIALAQASLDSTETDLERTLVRSPVDGVVLERAAEAGQAVAASFQPPVLFVLAEDLTRMELRLAVDEADIGRVQPGQRASFTVDAHPERTFSAEVRSVRNAPRTVQGVVTYEVVLGVDNGDGALRPGMTASAHIEVARAADVLQVPNAALRFTPPDREGAAGERVWVLRDGAPVAVTVEAGLSDGSVTEIRGALSPGDEVLVDVLRPEGD